MLIIISAEQDTTGNKNYTYKKLTWQKKTASPALRGRNSLEKFSPCPKAALEANAACAFSLQTLAVQY